MGWLSNLVKFENHFSVQSFKDIKDDPSRLLTGVDPASTKAWNAVLGTDNQALVNVWGSPGEQYYASAKAKGIDTGPASQFHAIADKVAAYYAGQGLSGSSFGESFSNFGGGTSPIENGNSIFNSFGDTNIDTSGALKIFNSFSTSSSNAAMANPISNANETQYGPIADKYAKQYGVPTDVFRSTINDVSGFNPYKVNPDGTGGIASMRDGAIKGVDIYNPNQSLETAAKTMAAIQKAEGGTWDQVASIFKTGRVFDESGNLATDSSGNMPAYDIMGNPTGMSQADANANDAATKDTSDDKPFWAYTSQDWKDFFSNSIYGLIFGIIGVVLILGSIFMLFKSKVISLPSIPK